MIAFLIRGMVFGLSAGISPGPLTALVISETLKHKTISGVKVAIAPLITDTPIILLCYFLLRQFSNVPVVLSLISIAGAFYIGWLGVESVQMKEFSIDLKSAREQSLLRGIVTNALSPHPYMFWMTVGATTMMQALNVNSVALLLFLSGFYCCLIGAKITLAILVGLSKTILNSRAFVLVNNILGFVLIFFAILLFYNGIRFFI